MEKKLRNYLFLGASEWTFPAASPMTKLCAVRTPHLSSCLTTCLTCWLDSIFPQSSTCSLLLAWRVQFEAFVHLRPLGPISDVGNYAIICSLKLLHWVIVVNKFAHVWLPSGSYDSQGMWTWLTSNLSLPTCAYFLR